jgi:hypothetical protein
MAREILSRYEWLVLADAGDTGVGPGCYGTGLRAVVEEAGPDAEVIIRDPADDADSNGGLYMVRNSALGQLFLERIVDKMSWPLTLVGGGCMNDQPPMNEALLELVALELGQEYNNECLPFMHQFPADPPDLRDYPGITCNYGYHLKCFRKRLQRLAGPFGARRTKRVRFLDPRLIDLNFRPYSSIPDGGVHFEPFVRTADVFGSSAESAAADENNYSPFLWHWWGYSSQRTGLADGALAAVTKKGMIAQHLGVAEEFLDGAPPVEAGPKALASWCEELEAGKEHLVCTRGSRLIPCTRSLC